MLRNIGRWDRALRILVGVALLTFALSGESTTWWALIGVVPLGTGLTGHCPLYQALHVSTARRREA